MLKPSACMFGCLCCRWPGRDYEWLGSQWNTCEHLAFFQIWLHWMWSQDESELESCCVCLDALSTLDFVKRLNDWNLTQLPQHRIQDTKWQEPNFIFGFPLWSHWSWSSSFFPIFLRTQQLLVQTLQSLRLWARINTDCCTGRTWRWFNKFNKFNKPLAEASPCLSTSL